MSAGTPVFEIEGVSKAYGGLRPLRVQSLLVRETAVVALTGLKRGARGQVRWSGTLMSAELDTSEPAQGLAEGTVVSIVAVKGNVLYVKQQ